MNEKMQQNVATEWTSADKWFFFGNVCFSVGTLSLSIANLINLSNSGRISDHIPTSGNHSRYNNGLSRDEDLHPSSYFRR